MKLPHSVLLKIAARIDVHQALCCENTILNLDIGAVQIYIAKKRCGDEQYGSLGKAYDVYGCPSRRSKRKERLRVWLQKVTASVMLSEVKLLRNVCKQDSTNYLHCSRGKCRQGKQCHGSEHENGTRIAPATPKCWITILEQREFTRASVRIMVAQKRRLY